MPHLLQGCIFTTLFGCVRDLLILSFTVLSPIKLEYFWFFNDLNTVYIFTFSYLSNILMPYYCFILKLDFKPCFGLVVVNTR